jgi:hypothetical protein
MVYQILAAFALDSCIKSKLRLTRISISTALPDSNSARATSKVTASMLDAAPSQLTKAMALSDKNSPTWRLENSMEIPR